MPRYVAFLRGVSPQNASMPALRSCFEAAGFGGVRTVLSSGNVIFDARSARDAALESRIEAAMQQSLDRVFCTIVRPIEALQDLLLQDPFSAFAVPRDAKRVVSFLRKPCPPSLVLPPPTDGARILAVAGREVFTAYVPSPKGPVFMKLIEKTFGDAVTTRTWDTVKKCAAA
jgi:uncharacterized protein (DUF1697 family)